MGDIMVVRKAKPNQLQAVIAFYYDVIDAVGDSGDSVKWRKDVYPSPAFLSDSIGCGELFIAEEGGLIVGAMVLNQQSDDAYRAVKWPTQAEDTEVTVIHVLAIRQSHRNLGYAKQMVRFAIDCAREQRHKAIRLDVLKDNRSAKALYSGMGFQYLQTVTMYYEDTGWAVFDLYEYPL